MMETVLPALVRDVDDRATVLPTDGASLTAWLHAAGINMRYLGAVVHALQHPVSRNIRAENQAGSEGDKEGWDAHAGEHERAALVALCEEEMVARAAKWWLRRVVHGLPTRAARERSLATIVTHWLNSLVGSHAGGHAFADATLAEVAQAEALVGQHAATVAAQEGRARAVAKDMTQLLQALQHGQDSNALGLALAPRDVAVWAPPREPALADTVALVQPAVVWTQLRAVLQWKFRYAWRASEWGPDRKRRLLRNVCLMMGLQLTPRDWDWAAVAPLVEDDVVAVVPRVAAPLPACTGARAVRFFFKKILICLTGFFFILSFVMK